MPISAKWKHKSSIHIGFIVFNGGVTTFFAKSVATMTNNIPLFHVDLIVYPCPNPNAGLVHQLKEAPGRRQEVNELNCISTLQWPHNGRDSVSNHQPHDCLLNHVFRRRSKKTSKLRVTGLYAGNSPVTGEFPAQMASYAENVSIWWRHHEITILDKVAQHT